MAGVNPEVIGGFYGPDLHTWKHSAPIMPHPSPHQRLEYCLQMTLSAQRRGLLVGGLCFGLLGVLALLLPAAQAMAIPPGTGSLLIIAGAAGLACALFAGPRPARSLSALSPLISLAAGLYLLGSDFDSPRSLAFVFAAYFGASGGAVVWLAAAHRRALLPRWEWLLTSGVMNLNLAWIILAGLPGPFTQFLSVLLGVSFLFKGSALLAVAAAGDAASAQERAAQSLQRAEASLAAASMRLAGMSAKGHIDHQDAA